MGNDYKILEIRSIHCEPRRRRRVHRVGFNDRGSQKTEETRLMIDRGAGSRAGRTGADSSGGIISGIETLADINDNGDLLVIVERKKALRGAALVLFPRV